MCKSLISEDKFKELKLDCKKQGKLLNSSIFEYNNNIDIPKKQCHILIWLNTNPRTNYLEDTGEYYYPLINLLNCRSKIIYARYQAIYCNKKARKEYSELEEKVIHQN